MTNFDGVLHPFSEAGNVTRVWQAPTAGWLLLSVSRICYNVSYVWSACRVAGFEAGAI